MSWLQALESSGSQVAIGGAQPVLHLVLALAAAGLLSPSRLLQCVLSLSYLHEGERLKR